MNERNGAGRTGGHGLITPRLEALAARRSVRRSREPSAAESEGSCELCAQPIGPRHGHLVDIEKRSLLCACRACSLLFMEEGAGGARYRLVPDRVRRLAEFELDEMDWLALRIPVDLAFFFYSSAVERVIALYPGPMGATESLLPLGHWKRMERRNPVLAEIAPDVEALLVDRTRNRRTGWLVPIDVCYELVALFRTRWVGLSGGPEVWNAVEAFFDDLRSRAEHIGGG